MSSYASQRFLSRAASAVALAALAASAFMAPAFAAPSSQASATAHVKFQQGKAKKAAAGPCVVTSSASLVQTAATWTYTTTGTGLLGASVGASSTNSAGVTNVVPVTVISQSDTSIVWSVPTSAFFGSDGLSFQLSSWVTCADGSFAGGGGSGGGGV